MSNPSPGISGSSPRGNKTLIAGGIVFGLICFFAGRWTIPSEPRRIIADPSPIPPAANSNAVGVKSIAASAAEFPAGTNHAAASPWDDKQWQQLLSAPGTPARSTALAAMLEQLAMSDPDRAMTLAHAERNLLLRESLVQAALHGWARSSPTNAATWALALTDSNERDRAVATVFAGAVATSPDDALRLGKSLMQQHPDDAAGCGHSLIDALCDAGNFEAAAHLAAGGDKDLREGWMAEAFSKWAAFQPEQAAQAAQAMEDPEARNLALHGIVGGWAEADPASLIQFVTRLPADAERGPLLSQSLERWVKVDAEAASAWINKNDVGPELDEGVAAVASMDFLKPDVAAGWAESVVNPKLRSETLVTVIRNWLTVDLPAAKHYFESSKNLLPADRQELTEVFATFSNDSTRP